MHTPVLLRQVIDNLDIKKGGKYIDATYGEGGHSREIVKQGGKVLAIELDKQRYTYHVTRSTNKNVKLILGNYRDIEKIARENNFVPALGILFDLGISMEQINRSGRGFSYQMINEPLDMRISSGLKDTAADIVNSYTVDMLYEIFSRYSQEIDSRPIAEAISRARNMKKIQTVGELVSVISTIKPKNIVESRLRRVFQALRMEVNDELNNIKQGISGALNILKPGGKILIISFNQTEDRLVKSIFRTNDRLKSISKIRSKSGYSFEKTATLRIADRNNT